jgi:hypothetical protein
MNKQELAEQIAEKHLDVPAKVSISFEEWLSTVDKILRTLNYHHTELDKKSWKLLYDDGYSPFKAVSESEFEGNLTWKEYVKLRNNGVYHEIILQPTAPAKEVEAISDSPDWKQLRDKFFKECTETYEAGKGLNILRKVSYNIAPHDLFEWFKRELTAKEAISVPAQNNWRERFTAYRLSLEGVVHFDQLADWIEKNVLAAQPLQPSLEEKKEDLVVSDINSINTACDKNINENV